MKNEKLKKDTIGLIEIMIKNVNKGPSGFWTDDYEGCGNPDIFPEFENGLRYGKNIYKQHYICPWNTAILFGDGHVNIYSGCYYSCSIRDAKYLSSEMLRAVLLRFNKRLKCGKYDNIDGHIEPLLTPSEQNYIKNQKRIEQKNKEIESKERKITRAKKADKLLKKYSNNEYVRGLIENYYGENTMVMMYDFGYLDFSTTGISDIVYSKKLTYDDYIDIQIQSEGKQREYFKMCYYNLISELKGCVERKTKDKICFKRIFVTGMYSDDCSFFEGKEDHVWMDIKGFETLNVGDCVSFFAEVYRYIKTGRGKVLDFGLRNPKTIKKIDKYKLPSDDDIIKQSVNEIICETCYLANSCYCGFCLRNYNEIKTLKEQMFNMIKDSKKE